MIFTVMNLIGATFNLQICFCLALYLYQCQILTRIQPNMAC